MNCNRSSIAQLSAQGIGKALPCRHENCHPGIRSILSPTYPVSTFAATSPTRGEDEGVLRTRVQQAMLAAVLTEEECCGGRSGQLALHATAQPRHARFRRS